MIIGFSSMVVPIDEVEASGWEVLRSIELFEWLSSSDNYAPPSIWVSTSRSGGDNNLIRFSASLNTGHKNLGGYNATYNEFLDIQDYGGKEFRARFAGTFGDKTINVSTTPHISYDKYTNNGAGSIDLISSKEFNFVGGLSGRLYLEWRTPNTAPTTPSSITVPTSLKSGTNSTISWGSSSDADGDSLTYRLERSINSGSYTQVYSGSARSYLDTPEVSWNTVTYRVRAYDGTVYSGYRTSPLRTVTHNTAPTLTITSPSKNSYFGNVVIL